MLFKCNLATKMLKKKKKKKWILIQEFIPQNSLISADMYKICNEKNTSI